MRGSERTLYHKLTQLRSEDYISKAIYLGETLYVLTRKGKEALTTPTQTQERARVYEKYFGMMSTQIVKATDTGRTVRQQKQGEIISAMGCAGIASLVGEKPLLGTGGRSTGLNGNWVGDGLENAESVYYTSVEMRAALGISSRFAASARLYGVLATGGEVYGIYHTGEKALTTSFNKEIFAFDEFCGVLSANGYVPGYLSKLAKNAPPHPNARANGVQNSTSTTPINEAVNGTIPSQTQKNKKDPDKSSGRDTERIEEWTGDGLAEYELSKTAETFVKRFPRFADPAVWEGQNSEARSSESAKHSPRFDSFAEEGRDILADVALVDRNSEADDDDDDYSEASAAGSYSEADGEAVSSAAADDGSEAVTTAKRSAASRRAEQKSIAAKLNYTANSSEAVRYVSAATQDKLAEWLGHYYVDTIIFGDGYSAAVEMLEKARSRYSIIKPAPDTFRSMRYIPIGEFSTEHLRLITTPGWKEIMNHIIFKRPPKKDESSGCDGVVDGEFWYNFCDLDLVRIRELLDYLKEMSMCPTQPKITIWALAHHEEFLRGVFGEYEVKYKFTQADKLMAVVDKIVENRKEMV